MNPRKASLLTLLLLAPPTTAQDSSEKNWSSDDSLHFVVHHEKRDSALGDFNRLDRVFEAMRGEMGKLVSWIDQDKTHVYFYKDHDAYLRGRFRPPPWSGGLFNIAERAVALYEPVETAVVAHELTHLYLHSFFKEKGGVPPRWLDEGLAGMLENETLAFPDPRDKGPVLDAPIPLEDFFKTAPRLDTPKARVSAWYQQAHSVVRFIKRGHIENSFVDFCAKLREGEGLDRALYAVYGYSNLESFETAWKKWRPKQAVGLPVGL